MDDNIRVCAITSDGVVRVYDPVPKRGGPRPYVKQLQFTSYGKACQFAIEFEEKEREELKKRMKR